MFKTVKILTNMSSVNSRIVRIQTAQFHYSTINFLVSKYSIFVLHTSIDSNSAVSNSEMYFLDKNARYSRTYYSSTKTTYQTTRWLGLASFSYSFETVTHIFLDGFTLFKNFLLFHFLKIWRKREEKTTSKLNFSSIVVRSVKNGKALER